MQLIKVVAMVPNDGPAWHELGLTQYELRNLPGAETAFLQAATKTDHPAASPYMLAVIAALQGRTDTAYERLARAVERSKSIDRLRDLKRAP